jgi:hypothetical protein
MGGGDQHSHIFWNIFLVYRLLFSLSNLTINSLKFEFFQIGKPTIETCAFMSPHMHGTTVTKPVFLKSEFPQLVHRPQNLCFQV